MHFSWWQQLTHETWPMTRCAAGTDQSDLCVECDPLYNCWYDIFMISTRLCWDGLMLCCRVLLNIPHVTLTSYRHQAGAQLHLPLGITPSNYPGIGVCLCVDWSRNQHIHMLLFNRKLSNQLIMFHINHSVRILCCVNNVFNCQNDQNEITALIVQITRVDALNAEQCVHKRRLLRLYGSGLHFNFHSCWQNSCTLTLWPYWTGAGPSSHTHMHLSNQTDNNNSVSKLRNTKTIFRFLLSPIILKERGNLIRCQGFS